MIRICAVVYCVFFVQLFNNFYMYKLEKQNNTIVVTLSNPRITNEILTQMFNEFVTLYKEQTSRFCAIINFSIYKEDMLPAQVIMEIINHSKEVWPVTEQHLVCLAVILPPSGQSIVNSLMQLLDSTETRLVSCKNYNEAISTLKRRF